MTYRSVLANREFLAILLSQGLSIAGDQVLRIAVAVLVYRETSSALAASATFAVSYLTYLMAGPLLSAVSDRYSRLAVMVISDLGRAATVLVLALSSPPTWGIFALLVVLSTFAPAFDSARSATLPDILPGDAYPRGSALGNLVFQGAQVGGFAVGGALLASVSVRQALVLDAATFLVSAGAITAFVLTRRPEERSSGTSLLQETAEGARLVWRDGVLRRYLGFAVLGAVAVSAPESLAVPIAYELGGGTTAAGVLSAALPAGFVGASFFVLRLPEERRSALLPGLVALSAIPLLLTPAVTNPAAVACLWVVSGMGASLQLVASAGYVAAAPAHARGRAYGIASTMLMASQGVAQLVAGSLSKVVGGHRGGSWGVALLAAACLVSLVPLSDHVPSRRIRAQGISEVVR